ncbi:MAG: hypothetical protein C0599_08045 [Salinivirgaceae bacterium]|nr:MAG: hypothetical protein C0599_08045 [Salinivirgaceae bacterium]
MKSLSIILFLIFAVHLSFSQNDRISKDFNNNQKSKRLRIQAGRQLLIRYLENEDFDKLKEIKNKLYNNLEDSSIRAIYKLEKWHIAYLTGDYDDMLIQIKTEPSKAKNQYTRRIQPPRDRLYQLLKTKLKSKREEIEEIIQKSQRSSEEKDFLILSLRNILKKENDPDTNQSELNNLADAFLMKYPKSKYVYYVRIHIRNVQVPAKWAASFTFQSGYIVKTGGFAKQYDDHAPFAISFTFYYRKFALHFIDQIGAMKNRIDVPLQDEDLELWEKGESASYTNMGLSLGYVILENKTFRITPHIGSSVLVLSPSKEEYEPLLKDVLPDITPTFMIGINYDIRIAKSNITMLSTGEETANWFIRLGYMYSKPQFSSQYKSLNGATHSLTIAFGGFGRKYVKEYR